ncbi:MAG: hypothetical protein A3G39_07790 [Deltaproteobacteria bacterium RIFCSPLOWO2_12_FULL_43_16]|nr:MAG: hypothetical protein A2Z89_05585 [Deltaproteobacteria bacterium GWA2_43_19]OGQ12115.1 MAG: hypothetical protein A3D30_07195 [Deltaproteobacteria bacterium RIFCSPHIGHO2_02_FULL_43_33]OGQ61521.1 MAG: hypothetical protein A3G39_07790 [Deltaproteobacteria bacterium RIFCSPLOWO2_12_FULL_43_16]HBR16140.1 hypothetical protein [Deltaproteobacteria bacterium]
MRRFLLLPIMFLLFALTGWLYFGTNLKTIPDAFATGGAFPNTKHGGGTVDGIKFPGINRAIGGDVTSYFGDNPEAGDYQAGECAHCHEPHASFSGYEPPPNSILYNSELTSTEAAGPDPYLLFGAFESSASQGTYSKLCWYCHEKMSLGIPPNPPGYGYWGFYQGKNNYTVSSHYISPNFYWPGADVGTNIGVGPTEDTNKTWPRKRRSSSGGNVGSCLNCHTPHGIANPSTPLDNGAPSNTNYVVGTTTAGAIIPRQLIAWEEALCLNCHDSTGPATSSNIKTQVDNFFLAAGSGHPVRKGIYFNRHNLANENPNDSTKIKSGWLITAPVSPHSECTDCHNPHRVQGKGSGLTDGVVFQPSTGTTFNNDRYDTPADSTSSPVKLGAVNIGVWGVNVNTGTGAVINSDVIPNLTTSNRVYNLCLKCHSAWAWGAATGTDSAITTPSTDSTLVKSWTNSPIPANEPLTDVAWEFATTGKLGYHPVFASGLNRPENTNVRNPNWCNEGGSVYNTTCTVKIGDRKDLYDAGLMGTVGQTLSQNFVPPWRHTSIITCVDCHEDNTETTPRGPHGSGKPFILRQVDGNISFTICNTASTCGGGTSVSYATLGATADSNNVFCYNCHRADIYGIDDFTTTYATFARITHPMHGSSNTGTGGLSQNTNNPRGISCMRCHGGGGGAAATPTTANSKLGNIHGSAYNSAGDGGQNRLIAPRGAWVSWVRPAAGASINCTRGGDTSATYNMWGGCSNSGSDGVSDTSPTLGELGVANYTY